VSLICLEGFVRYLGVHSVYLPASLFFPSTNAIMGLRVTSPSEQPMPATIDIPDPATWTVLDGDAVTQTTAGGNPSTMPSYLGADSTRTLTQYLRIPIYLGYIIFGRRLFGTGTGATDRLSTDKI
jgi:hypothetical protein